MKFLHRTKDQHGRSTPLPAMQPPLSSAARGSVGLQRMQEGSGVNALTPIQQVIRRLALRGYRIHSGAIWYIANDDPERGLEEVLIANWDGTPQDAWDNLKLHDWPTSPFVMCQTCGSGEADFGGECHFCARESADWARVGE